MIGILIHSILSSTNKIKLVKNFVKIEYSLFSELVVESDKADMDVEAFEDGFIAKILVGEGESAPVGDTVALLVAEEADIASAAAAGDVAEAAPAATDAASPPPPLLDDLCPVVSDP